jgi:hypothetical protein
LSIDGRTSIQGDVQTFFEWCQTALVLMKTGEKKALNFEQDGFANGTKICVELFKGPTIEPKCK